MTKELKKPLLFSVGIMIILPICITLIFSLPVTSGWGMLITMILFFAINPMFTVWLGAFCSKDIKKYWSIPFFNALFYIAGVWCAFDFGNLDFFVYAAAYFCIGYVTMFIFYFFDRFKKH